MAQSLLARVEQALEPWLTAPAWHVALSGGLDSTVLLHLLVELRRMRPTPPLRAVHVNHQLHPDAGNWACHCETLCRQWAVPLRIVSVDVAGGASLEAQARKARQQAFAAHTGAGEVVIAAQHRDDQVETLLFRLFRGAGVRGLVGMQPARRLDAGWLVRPLLDIGRDELESHARAYGLVWVEDPSNHDLRFARNVLRHDVLPQIYRHWPSASVSIARAASNLSEADSLLAELAHQDLQQASADEPLPWLQVPNLALAPLGALSEPRQRNALRMWLTPYARLPDRLHWAGWQALRDAAADAQPRWRLADGEVQRAGGRIWFVAPRWQAAPVPIVWPGGVQALQLPDNGVVERTPRWVGGEFEIRYRSGGERMRLEGRGGRDLKRLLNEQGWPPFLRKRVPLLYRNGELVAVANMHPLIDGIPALRWTPPCPAAGLSW